MAASAKNVPEPHIGSKKSVWPSQPESNKIPAANTSFIGAILVAVLYPRWFKAFPEVSKATDTWSLSIWTLILKSGCTLSILGRCPVRSLN